MGLLWEREQMEEANRQAEQELEHASRDSAAVFAGVIEMARAMPEELREQLIAALSHQPMLKVVKG